PYVTYPRLPLPLIITILEPHSPQVSRPLNRYDRLRSVRFIPPNVAAVKRPDESAIRYCTAFQSSSDTMRHSGTGFRIHSCCGRGLLILRPVSGLRTFKVLFQTCTPRYFSLRNISRKEDGHHARIVRVRGGCGAATPSSFNTFEI